MTESSYKYLYRIDSPADLRKLSQQELVGYCDELRRFIIEQLALNPGHLGSSLGVVELTAALHYVFDTPYDKLIWDVGHQAYAHKIITGRRDSFRMNRKLNGLSGFPKMEESAYDAFGGGHASTSISAALGIATAAALRGERRHAVAVIGDGALTGGLAFEGLNNAGAANTDLLVILNDNRMAIDPNVGALKEYLLSISTSKRYNAVKNRAWAHMERTPRLRRLIQKVGNALKQGFLQQSNLFESLRFRYFGPVDGHDVGQLTRVLQDLKEIKGPKLLHVLTVKGKGYSPAERDQKIWHAPGVFNPETGERATHGGNGDEPPLYQKVFGETILELARTNDRIVGITPAMPTGCGLNILMREMPERCFDVGIAEGHAVTFSAGLAAAGMVPFCNIYSSFMQRAYDNVIHDVALQGLNVVMCLDRAGLVGEDGATHQGVFDVAYLRHIPNMHCLAPRDENMLVRCLTTAVALGKPCSVRYPRGAAFGVEVQPDPKPLPYGKGEIVQEGETVAILALGSSLHAACDAADEVHMRLGFMPLVFDPIWIKPLPEEQIADIFRRFDKILTVEESSLAGGFGSAVLEYASDHGLLAGKTVKRLGVPDRFIEHASQAQQRHELGLDVEGIYRAVEELAGGTETA